MKMISWNYRGMGSPLTVHNLKGICKSHSLEIGFFCETKNPTSLVEKQLRRCGFTRVFCVDPLGRAGGVAIGWKEQAKVSIIRHGQYFIIFSVSDDSLQQDWVVIGVHFHSCERTRENQFEEILDHIGNLGSKILITGDFNAITGMHEKEEDGTSHKLRLIGLWNSLIEQECQTSVQRARDSLGQTADMVKS